MIVLFTDFGRAGPYVGQMQAVCARLAPGMPVIDLFADAPAFEPQLAAYLLAAYVDEFPAGTVFCCVVDPGVGSDRLPVALQADGRWFVGPDNGLLGVVEARAAEATAHEIAWRPERLSASFHGRDLFAPVAARLARGTMPDWRPLARPLRPEGWPDDLARVVYVDPYGNAMTGLRADTISSLAVGGRGLPRLRTFAEAAPGAAFWYENANGLAEIAVNRGSAAASLGLRVGDVVQAEG
ncbi:MAG: SAM-dependent chlorinase/fluorinase [Alphaproteobacteria bacterium]